MFDQHNQNNSSTEEIEKIKETIKNITLVLSSLKNSITDQLTINKLSFEALLQELESQVNFKISDFESRVGFMCQLLSIEKEIADDNTLNLESKDVIEEKFDVVKLLMDISIDGEAEIKDEKGSVYIIGNGKLPQQIEEDLIGKKVGDSFSVSIKYNEEATIPHFANKLVNFNIKVVSVKKIKNLK